MCTAKGSDVRPGVPWVSASFAWQAWHIVHCQGVGCTPWRPLGLRRFCVAGVGQCALPRGRMYALASLGSPPLLRGRRGTMCTAKGSDVRPGVPWVSASFAWQAWDNVHCQGVGCTPWRPLGLRRFCVAGVAQCALPRGWMYALASLGSPPLLRGRRGTMCTAKGSDVRPGVPWVSASFAWQAWHNVHCQGVGCTPWRPLGLRLFCVAGVAQCALPRGWMYALASLGSPPLLRGRRGTMCTAKGLDVRPGVPWVSVAFAWQAWHNVHCQGVGCTPWRLLGLRLFCVAGVAQCALPRGWMYALASLGSPPLLRGRRGTMCTAKGLDVRPGVPWVSASFAWQAWDNVHCQGVGCTPWRPLALASLGSPLLLRGRRGTMCIAKGLDVRPGVPWVSASFAWQAWHNVHCQGVGCTPWRPLGLRRFCVAGVAQCALPRGWMYALASLGSPPLLRGRRGTMCTAKGSDVRPGVPWVSASFAWQAWDNVHFAWQVWGNVRCQGVGSHCSTPATQKEAEPKDARAYIRPLGSAHCPTPATQKRRSPRDARAYIRAVHIARLPRKRGGAQGTPGRTSDPLAVHIVPPATQKRRSPRDARAYIRPLGSAHCPTPATQKRRSARDARAYIRPLGSAHCPTPATQKRRSLRDGRAYIRPLGSAHCPTPATQSLSEWVTEWVSEGGREGVREGVSEWERRTGGGGGRRIQN